ncbi:MAG: iron ABC transporter permease [Bacteroidales bacterium]|nr:iron ABC transporter permease [Bacteroidales bacterium]
MKPSSQTAFMIIVVLLLMAADLCAGGAGLGLPDRVIFVKLRLPRMLTAVLAGASLALAGLQMQSIFRNPLADPHIMGVSAGAGTGAAVATLIVGTSLPAALSGLTVVSAAFIGALLSSLLVMMVSSRMQSATTLLIFGVMLGFVFSAITSILEYSANAESLKVFYSWSAGSFIGNGQSGIIIIAAALLIGLVLALLNNRGLDLSLFGDDYTAMAGASPSRIRNISMVGSCLMAGAVTAFCGPLGFVGIVSSHIARSLIRSSVHLKTIPATFLVGAGLSLIADILSQVFPTPLPVGSTMAIIGIPIILFILLPVPERGRRAGKTDFRS